MKLISKIAFIGLLGTFPLSTQAKDDNRGLLPEVRMDSQNENENERRAVQAELLITHAETKAIQSLQKLLAKKKGTAEEAGLQHRLAELYMRRSRTGRFFDLHQNSKTLKLSTFPIPSEKGADWIRKASGVYYEIEKKFPNYREIDSVLFNNAFANQQLGKIRESEVLYQRMIDKRPNSSLVPDAAVALGELAYDQRRFALALNHLALVEKYPKSRVYTYALYKAAWAHYNMKDAELGTKKLIEVVKASAPDESTEDRNRQNLRREALRDLGIFVADSKSADDLYDFFKKITTEEELGQSMMDMANLYLSHSRYKEINIFLDEFLRKHPSNPTRVKATLVLVDGNESLKQRDKVLDHLRAAAEACGPKSSWKAKQDAETLKASCEGAFTRKSHEIAGKWWDVWQKNKNHKEFSGLTEQALKVVLDNEDPAAPDISSRFAYAELLFQLGRFEEASDNYHRSAESLVNLKQPQKTTQKGKLPKDDDDDDAPGIKKLPSLHDADYGALFSMEKAIEKKKTSLFEAKRKDLAQLYLKRHPKGDHAGDVTFRMAAILYEEQDLEGSRKWLDPLLIGQSGRTLQVKAEDLALDILNLKKDFKGLSDQAKVFAQRETDSKRRDNLKKIEIESAYSAMQNDLKTVDKKVAADRLREFAKAHEGSKLANEALYQSAALDFVEGRGLSAAASIESFASQNSSDPRLLAALKDSARVSAEAGEMEKAARLLKQIADKEPKNRAAHLESAGDFYLMENNFREARAIYNNLLPNAPSADRSRLYNKLLQTFRKDPQSPEITRLENLVLQQNLEPFATQILTKRAQDMMDKGKRTEAFEAARKIISRDAPSEMRAEARLLQARILEREFIGQSVKTSKVERFGNILSMKLERLEKAQTAYLGASKMTSNPKILADSFSGIDRCYSHLVEVLEHLPLPPGLEEADQKALKTEIGKILVPIRDKRDDNRKQIRGLASAASGEQSSRWEDLGGDTTPAPMVPAKWTFLKPYVPENWSEDAKKIDRAETEKKSACDAKKPVFHRCFMSGQYDVAEKSAREMTQDKAQRVRGFHHLSLIADAKGMPTKALWMLNLAEKENPAHALIHYEKARLLIQLDDSTSASSEIAKVLNTSMSSTEIGILKGFKAFSEGDSKAVKTLFSGFSKQELYHLNLGPLLSESLAQAGELDGALKLITDLTTMGTNAELLIQQGRLNEVYKFAPVPALEAYEKALRLAKDPAQKEWLLRKKEYLKVNFKVGLNVTSGG
ncbi:MAG: tetratricopeptide repeat protein [Bdellovibrionaceae bacterium]|nr:tetratricopeptide repeat protein [Pseudobdellovibrionaceae bacterium]